MKWQNREGSRNVEDRRGQSSGRRGGVAAGGVGGIILAVVVMIAGYNGVDLSFLLGDSSAPSSTSSQTYKPSAAEQELARFTSVTLKTTEDAWKDIFRNAGKSYTPPKMVLYTGETSTSCGYGQSAMGPFYCPADQTLYIDLSFYQDMQKKLGGGGDFALGYVIAHEVGHHVQHLLGTERQVRNAQKGRPQSEVNRLSVLLELQADCLAGVWGNYVQRQGILETGDLQEALNTAEAIGDDRLQRQSGGRVVPDSFTHGTSKQRYEWFNRGFKSGSPNQCDTFANM